MGGGGLFSGLFCGYCYTTKYLFWTVNRQNTSVGTLERRDIYILIYICVCLDIIAKTAMFISRISIIQVYFRLWLPFLIICTDPCMLSQCLVFLIIVKHIIFSRRHSENHVDNCRLFYEVILDVGFQDPLSIHVFTIVYFTARRLCVY